MLSKSFNHIKSRFPGKKIKIDVVSIDLSVHSPYLWYPSLEEKKTFII